MSYEIIYGKQFIKTSRGIIPLILHGSNNCYSVSFNGRERRERNWSTCYHKTGEYTEKELMDSIMAMLPSEYGQHFMLGTKWVDDPAFVTFYKNGIKGAKTIEQIFEQAKNVSFLRGYVSLWVGNKNTITMNTTIRTTKELEDFMDMAMDRKNHKEDGESDIYINLTFVIEEPIKFKQAESALPKGKCIVKYKGKTVSKIEYQCVSYGGQSDPLVFDNGEAALAAIKENKIGTALCKIVAYKPKNNLEKLAIKIEYENGDFAFFVRSNRNGYNATHYQSSAKVFTDRKVAEKFVRQSKLALNAKCYKNKIANLSVVTL